jgi:uncharacterized membrane protein SpoIIM required for sporulation
MRKFKSFDFWKKLKKKVLAYIFMLSDLNNYLKKVVSYQRLKLAIVCFIVFMLFEFSGLLFPNHEQTTLALAQIKEMQSKNFIGKVGYIFRENAVQNTYFAVPLFGVVYAFKVAFVTGQAIAGIVSLYLNITNRYDLFMTSFNYAFMLAIMPHGLLEYGAYSLTMASNFLFSKTVLFPKEEQKDDKKKILKEALKDYATVLAIAFILLVLAAIAEAPYIKSS